MQNVKINGLIADLKKRAEGREQALLAVRKNEEVSPELIGSEEVHQARIDEIEYVIDELQQLLEDEKTLN